MNFPCMVNGFHAETFADYLFIVQTSREEGNEELPTVEPLRTTNEPLWDRGYATGCADSYDYGVAGDRWFAYDESTDQTYTLEELVEQAKACRPGEGFALVLDCIREICTPGPDTKWFEEDLERCAMRCRVYDCR